MTADSPRRQRAPISAPDFARIESIFASMLDLDFNARAAVVADQLRDRPDLQRELEELLLAHDRLVEAGGDDDGEGDAWVGLQVGAYRLVEKIGEGGMGEVYRAERADRLFQQQVAVKITRSNLANSELRRRFAVERQILASLNHDHIVGLLDGGTTESGQAYVIMEYVAGVPLTQHCRDEALSLEERLRLFVAVCRAVQYAHQHGVVHRDLKPANILVTADHVPKVLDFGVAKLLESGVAGSGLTTTGVIPGPLTPNYASPEQLSGTTVTTAADVYALGVILYEIVSGARPYETHGMPIERVINTVLHLDPPPPGAARPHVESAPPYLLRRLDGDINAIVLKAMRKQPIDRYASASELATDLERWLNGDPVLARAPSPLYVLGRFARRHRRLVAGSALAASAIVAASGVAVWQWQSARREQARAEQRFDDIRQLANAVIFKIHDEVKALPGSTPVRRMIVDEAIGYLERLGAEAGSNAELRLEVARAFQQIGSILGEVGAANLGDRDGAIKQYERARATVIPLMTAAPAFDVVRVVVDSDIRLSELHAALGRQEVAMQIANQAIASCETFLARNPGHRQGEELQARAFFNLALRSPRDEGMRLWQKTYEYYEKLLAAGPGDFNARRNVALVAKYLGGNLENSAPAEALKYYKRSLELDEQRLNESPDDQRVQFDAAISFSNMAAVSDVLGDVETASRLFDRSLELRRRRVQADPSNVQGRSSLGYLLTRIALFHAERDPQRARALSEEAIEVVAPVLAKTEDRNALQATARAWYHIATINARLGDRGDGCEAVRRAARAYQSVEKFSNNWDRSAARLIDERAGTCGTRAR